MVTGRGIGVERFVVAGGEGPDGDGDAFGAKCAAEGVGGEHADGVVGGLAVQGEGEGEPGVRGDPRIDRGRGRDEAQARDAGQGGGEIGRALLLRCQVLIEAPQLDVEQGGLELAESQVSAEFVWGGRPWLRREVTRAARSALPLPITSSGQVTRHVHTR